MSCPDRLRSRIHSADERGTVTVWMLGMLIMVLFLGGLSLDLWRAFSARRSVAGIVDAAAIAGASGIDEPHLRATGEPRLDPGLAYDLAAASLTSHSDVIETPAIDVAADGSSITVAATRDVPFTLLRVLLPELDSRRVGARATSPPRRASP